MSPAGSTTIDSAFWREQAERFLSLRRAAIERSIVPLGASYHPDGWGFDEVPGFRCTSGGRWLLNNGTPEIVEEFKSVADVCAVALGAPNIDKIWVEWLDCLRREGIATKSSEIQISARHAERRPDPDFEVVAAGLMFYLDEIRPDPDAKIIPIQLLDIDDVCGASERVCRRLADEALKAALTQPTHPALDRAAASDAGHACECGTSGSFKGADAQNRSRLRWESPRTRFTSTARGRKPQF